MVEPLELSRLRAASYDTHIGGVWIGKPKEGRPKTLSEDEEVVLNPGDTRYVHSREHFRMPVDIVGRIGPTVDLITSGVSVSHGPLIAPLFEGKLTVALHNFTTNAVSVSTKERFIKVVFEKLQARPEARHHTIGLDSALSTKLDKSFLEAERDRVLAELETLENALETAKDK